ncbi:hypothetical protein BDW72DRAFT_193853 [Aspergillus terricola var. indicus]
MARDLRPRTVHSNGRSGKTRHRAVKGKAAKSYDTETQKAVAQRGNDQQPSDWKAKGLQSTKQNGKNRKIRTQRSGDQETQNQEGISLEFLPTQPTQILPGLTGEDLPIVPSRIKDSVLNRSFNVFSHAPQFCTKSQDSNSWLWTPKQNSMCPLKQKA